MKATPTFEELAEASGMLRRAGEYLFRESIFREDLSISDAQAVGTLLGLSFLLRPQLVHPSDNRAKPQTPPQPQPPEAKQ